jgi:hypothetical protein
MAPSAPWIMRPGTPTSHIMVVPPPPEPEPQDDDSQGKPPSN